MEGGGEGEVEWRIYFISYSGYSINERIRKQMKIKYLLSLLDVMKSTSVAWNGQ